MAKIMNPRKFNVKNPIKMRREIKRRFIEKNMELFTLARNNLQVRTWKHNPHAQQFVEKARKEVGYSDKTYGYDILNSFHKL